MFELAKRHLRTLAMVVASLSPYVSGATHINDNQQGINPVASDSQGNTAMGSQALNSTLNASGAGSENTAAGQGALVLNTTGSGNSAFGQDTLSANRTGSQNSAFGTEALQSSTGNGNSAFGASALFLLLSGNYNSAFGFEACQGYGSGASISQNTAIGFWSSFYNDGNNNIAVGYEALYNNTTGSNNLASGVQALYNSSAEENLADGTFAMYSNTSGNLNTALGFQALYQSTTGSSNIVLGAKAGFALTSSTNDIEIGNDGAAGERATTRIGTNGTQTATYFAGVSGTSVSGKQVYVTSTGQLGVIIPPEDYKTNVAPIHDSKKVAQLRPVTFHLRTDPSGPTQYGLVAEEVAKIYPELVIRSDDGRIDGVRYEELTTILIRQTQSDMVAIRNLELELSELRHAAQLLKLARQSEDTKHSQNKS